ncbi:MAG TPA: DUF2092 domain-containing protein [Blastocatellia bacterium]|nr:DUF2092 domain-containing protein [Blastocatellia bacterium]
MSNRTKLFAIAGMLIVLTVSACHEGEGPTAKKENVPATDEEKRAQGDAILNQMSEKLKSAQAATFSTTESIDRVKGNNEKVHINLERQLAVRQPDKMWFKATGDRDLECFYDGKMLTLVSHKEKVFGEVPAPPTLHETAEMITDKYGISLPISDLLTADPQKALKDEETTGGWNRRETLNGVVCNVLSYQHPAVDFSLWVPVSGDPLPQKLEITYKARRGQPSTTVTFKGWNLAPQLSDETFARKVPDDYEGIAVIQRESAVIPPEEAQQQEPPPAAKEPAKPKSK